MNWLLNKNPTCMIFPRSLANLFDYQVNQGGSILGPVRYKDPFPSFLDHDDGELDDIVNYDTGKKDIKLKQIDTRVYLDLWKQKEGEGNQAKTETKKKVTLGILKDDGGDKYSIYDRYDKSRILETAIDAVSIKVDAKNSGKKVYITAKANGSVYSNKDDVSNPVVILGSCLNKNYLLEIEVCVTDSTRSVPSESSAKIEVQAQLIIKGKAGSTTKMTLELYRHRDSMNGSDKEPLEKFKKKSGKDHDFFVLPCVNQESAHEKIIKRLQVLNNQVIARHAGLSSTQFTYVDEDGKCSEVLRQNIRNCVSVFKDTKSGTEIDSLKTVFKYSFDNFGTVAKLSDSLAAEYGISRETVGELIVDRNLLYGVTDNPNIGQLLGLENLYVKVVEVFRDKLIRRAEEYVNFNQPWLGRPRFNAAYQRGVFTIPANTSMSLYNVESGGSTVETLVAGTKVSFYPAQEKHDLDDTWRYKVKSSTTQNGQVQNYPENTGARYIELTFAQRGMCNDKDEKENKGNYVSTEGLSPQDAAAVSEYGNHYGVPYYMTSLEGADYDSYNGGKYKLSKFQNTFTAVPRSWYDYATKSKPNGPTSAPNENVKGIGLDCSGLAVNCLLETTASDSVTKYFETTVDDFQRNAKQICSNRIRLFPKEKLELMQSADFMCSKFHIVICAIEKSAKVTTQEIQNRNFTIIHNYGEDHIHVDSPCDNGEYSQGFFLSNVKRAIPTLGCISAKLSE